MEGKLSQTMMSHEPEEVKVEPPMPDLPIDKQETPTSEATVTVDSPMEEAKREMASKIEHGASPIDFSGDVKEKKNGGASPANIAAGVAFLGLLGVAIIAGKMMNDIWSRLDTMSSTISVLSEKIGRKKGDDATQLAMIKTELQNTLRSLERASQSDDPEVSEKALALKAETEKLLESIEAEGKWRGRE